MEVFITLSLKLFLMIFLDQFTYKVIFYRRRKTKKGRRKNKDSNSIPQKAHEKSFTAQEKKEEKKNGDKLDI